MSSFSIEKELFRWIAVAGILLLQAGCDLRDDYSDCPATGRYEIKVDYTQNIDNRNYFENEITRLDFFFFDENGLFVEHVIDSVGPFVNGYGKIFEFPFGKYQAVIWGNLYADTRLSREPEKGVTPIGELQLNLVTTPTMRSDVRLENFAAPVPTTLFWGKTEVAEVFRGHHLVERVDLLKNTHDIHVTLRWKNYDGYYCFDTEHQKRTRAYILGSNGDMTFDNELPRERNVSYVPFYRDPAHPDIYAGQTGLSYIPPQRVVDDIAAVMPDGRTMRLTADGSTEKLVVTALQDDGSEKIVYIRSIVDLIRLTGHYNTQRSLDHTNDYHIVVDFRCIDPGHNHGSTWIAVSITVNGWVVKEINEEI